MSPRSAVLRTARNEYAWVGLAFIVSILVAYLVLQSVTTGTFDRLERENVQSQAARVRTSLGYEASLISSFVLTNSQWDDAYDVITQHQPGQLAT
ncbi:MAG: hypothetical protein ABSH51_18385, partial [Solirubrobacteraceae bacterium]